MKLPFSWLKEFVDVPVEPRRLGEDLTSVGLAMDGLLSDGKDAVFDLDITTNRVDCMNVYGVAREASVLYGVPLKPPPVEVTEAGEPAASGLQVRIEAADLCPRFCARVLDVRLGPSPAWLRERLEMVGVRPINNVVDLTNYVMLELGHPSHAFDLAMIPGKTLVARWGRQGETLRTLDGVERSVPASPRVGLVASPEGPLALAGVMGGASSEVSDATLVVALEAAYWSPLAIRRASRALGMHTEASHRFERGADPEAAALATTRIAHLLQKIGAGSPRPGLIDCVAEPLPARSTTLRRDRVSLVLGAPVPEARAAQILEGLGFRVGAERDGWRDVSIPTWRSDVSREADLIEEIGRHYGLDKLPSTLPRTSGVGGLKRWQARERRVRDVLFAAGLVEVITLSFPPDPKGDSDSGAAVRLLNPLAEDQATLRSSLVKPGLLASLQVNLRQGRRDVRLFEMGRVFLPAERLATEEQRLGILLAGEGRDGHWSERGRPVDFFDLSGILTLLCERLELPHCELAREPQSPLLHPGKSAALRFKGEPIGFVGALHPDLAERSELPAEVYVAELRLEPLLHAAGEGTRMQQLPRYPSVARDLSILCDGTAEAGALVEIARRAGGSRLRSVAIADRYFGAPVPEGRVSLMLSLVYQDPSRTLTGEEVDASLAAIQSALRKAGAEIRGE